MAEKKQPSVLRGYQPSGGTIQPSKVQGGYQAPGGGTRPAAPTTGSGVQKPAPAPSSGNGAKK
jgi:hypothetical protein